MMAKSFACTTKNIDEETKNIEKILDKAVDASSPGRYTVAASTETAKIYYEHTTHDSNQTIPRKLQKAYPTETTLQERLKDRRKELEASSSIRANWAFTRLKQETNSRNNEELEASKKQNKELLERQTNEFLVRHEEAKAIWYAKHAISHIRDDNSLNVLYDMKVMEYDDNEENNDDPPRTPEQQKLYELFYTKKDGGQIRTGNVKRDNLHAHKYEQYVKPYAESEVDSKK